VEAAAQSVLVGRETELAVLEEMLGSGLDARALVLVGEPGIGKTTLWTAASAAAGKRGWVVLSARPAAAEAEFSLAGLTDLLEGIAADVVDALAGPQRRALEVALLREEPEGAPRGPRVLAAAVLGVLRGLAAAGPVLVAVDDVQWLDPPSSQALAFAARRLAGDDVRFLLARREGSASALEGAFAAGELARLELGSLSFGAMWSIVARRVEGPLTRRVLRRVFEASGGNPLFALELARLFGEGEVAADGELTTLPAQLEELEPRQRLPSRVHELGPHGDLPAGEARLQDGLDARPRERRRERAAYGADHPGHARHRNLRRFGGRRHLHGRSGADLQLDLVPDAVCQSFAKAQDRNITDELNDGIRYLDLRVCGNGSLPAVPDPSDPFKPLPPDFVSISDNPVTCHELVSASLGDILSETRAFVDAHPDEVVFLDVNHLYQIDPDTLATKIEDGFAVQGGGSLLIPPQYCTQGDPDSGTCADPTKQWHSGATVPILVQLEDYYGTDVSAKTIPVTAQSVTDTGTGATFVPGSPGATNPGFVFHPIPTKGYLYDLKTTG
jgi:AAA ATPase domain